MKIAVIIPDRGDRPEFLEHCKKMLSNQTLKPSAITFADWPAENDLCDITPRYKNAYHALSLLDFDCVLFMENDDWYSPEYIETMVHDWIESGKPDLMGIGYTYYYHIGIEKYIKFEHPRRASMMNTLMKCGLNPNWPKDEYPYTDAWLWSRDQNPNLSKVVVTGPIISIGIKHGIGKSGGEYHRTKLERYKDNDPDFQWLSTILDKDSLNFYHNIQQKSFRG